MCQWHVYIVPPLARGVYHSTEMCRLKDIVNSVHDARYWLERIFSMKRIIDVAKRVHF